MSGGTMMGLGVAWYVLPYDRALAAALFRSHARAAGWDQDDEAAAAAACAGRATLSGGTLSTAILGLLLAQELGDERVASRLRRVLEVVAEPRAGSADGADGGADGLEEGEFGYFFGLGERYPRGQLSALLAAAEALSPGQWHRACNPTPNDAHRFSAPTVVGVPYPTLGVSAARNCDGGVLRLGVYDPSQTIRGGGGGGSGGGGGGSEQRVVFRVEQVPAAAGGARAVRVRCDGGPHPQGAWRYAGDGVIEIESGVGEHTFEIQTGYCCPCGGDEGTASTHAGL